MSKDATYNRICRKIDALTEKIESCKTEEEKRSYSEMLAKLLSQLNEAADAILDET